MGKVDDAIGSLEVAVNLLEEAVTAKERSHYAQKVKKPAPVKAQGSMDLLFSPNELSEVKNRLDDAIERLESALEGADGAR